MAPTSRVIEASLGKMPTTLVLRLISTRQSIRFACRSPKLGESFNGKFRDECLNEHWFETLRQARTEIAIWRQDYNEVRPHSSIGRIRPAEFAQRRRNKNQPPPATGKEIK